MCNIALPSRLHGGRRIATPSSMSGSASKLRRLRVFLGVDGDLECKYHTFED